MPRGRRTDGQAAPSTIRTWLRIAVVVAVLGTVGALQLIHAPSARADVRTGGQDLLRTDWDSGEPNLSASTVTGSNFGQLFATQLDGQIYAQPLVVGGTVLVSTENNWAYGLNAVTGAIIWSHQLGPAWPASTVSCGDLVPNLGNTSAGVFDPSTNTYYLTTKVNDGPDATKPNWYLHALDAATGAERSGWPTKIVGTPANDSAHPFNAETVNQRPALLLLNGSIYMAFGSQCDLGNYVGIVAGVNLTTEAISMWSDEVGPSSTQAGIWQSGGGIVSDGPGRMFVVTGNGVTAPDGPGNRPPQQLSESVIRLGVDGSGALSAQDFFAPYNAATLDLNDQDLASGAPVGLPSQYFGTTALPHLMVEIGKEGKLYLLNRDDLGGKAQGLNGTDAVIQELGPFHGVWGHPAVYGGEGGYIYVPQNDSNLLAFKYGLDGQGNPSFTLAGNTTETFGFTSGSPIITSDGATPGSAVLWVTNVDGSAGSNGRLCAYNAVPSNNHINLLRCFPIGTGVKFPTAASANGRVYTGTRDGVLFGFGQPVAAALNVPQTEFGHVTVGQSGTATVIATAVRPVTITALSTAAPFAVTNPPPALPVTLAVGDKLDVPVTFSPTDPGSINGTLNITLTDAGQTEQLGAALHGTAIKPGFTASPPTLTFADVPVGDSLSLSASFTNTGDSNETVQSVTPPSSAFTVSGLPSVGTVVAPGQAVNVSVTYTPTTTGSVTSSISVAGPDGTGTVSLVANAVTGVKQLSISPSSLTFGSIPVGLTSTQTITVTNTGNLNVTITKAAPPSLPYVVNTPLPEGLVMSPGDSVSVQVTFAPSAAGTFNNSYVISSDDGAGAHTIAVSGTAVAPTGGRPLPSIVGGGGWVFNGSAVMSGSDLVLTPAVANMGGSAVYSTPVSSAGLRATFTAQIGGGTGADGMTFALLDAATNTPHSLGQFGGGLGFSGLTGVAVTLDTYQGGTDPSNNFIGLTKGVLDANGNLTYVATATNIPNLRTGTHAITVVTTASTVTVSIDGVQVISTAVTLPGSVYPAFTGSTGGATDQHVVRAVTLTSANIPLIAPDDGWRFNGSAAISGSSVVLTPALNDKAGSVLYTRPVTTDGLTATFNLSMNGGTGADGATFELLDPASSTAASLGGGGSGLGFGGLAGVAVTFVTYPQSGVNSHNFVALMTSTAGGTPTVVTSNTNVTDLRSANHNVVVKVSGTTITASIDGTQVLSAAVAALTPSAIVGFSAATGGSNDVHAVSNVQVLTGPVVVPPPPDAGWQDNGSATTSGGTITLTPAANDKVGTAIYDVAVPTAHLDAKFTVQLNGGTGADGLSFLILDPSQTTPSSIGAGGGGLGYQGLAGVAVACITYAQPGYPSDSFIGLANGGSGGTLTFTNTSARLPNLRKGTHIVEVMVNAAGHVVVTMDGKTLFETAGGLLPPNALIGFSGATGGSTDVHAVSNIKITY